MSEYPRPCYEYEAVLLYWLFFRLHIDFHLCGRLLGLVFLGLGLGLGLGEGRRRRASQPSFFFSWFGFSDLPTI